MQERYEMASKRAKQLTKFAAFLLILILLFIMFSDVLSYKFLGINNTQAFHEQAENTVDVLILGSSHAYGHFDTATLYDEYGIAASVSGTPAQTLMHSYYHLKDALLTQSPKLVILEGYKLYTEDNFFDDPGSAINSTYGLSPSVNKIDAISHAFREPSDYFLEFYQYHTRYKDVSVDDFYNEEKLKNSKGSFYYFNQLSVTVQKELSGEANPIPDTAKKWYDKIIDYCNSRGINLMVVITPYRHANDLDDSFFQRTMAVYRTAEKYTESKGVPFFNLAQPDIAQKSFGLDYAIDMTDNAHMNYTGTIKFTKYIGKYISNAYNLPDRRGDREYVSWEENSTALNQKIRNAELKATTNVGSYITKINDNDNYEIVVVPTGKDRALYKDIKSKIQKPKALVHYKVGRSNDSSRHFDWSYHKIDLTKKNVIIIDREKIRPVKKGVIISVFDKINDEIVETIGIDGSDVTEVHR
jgi:hypothetical protein